MPHLATSVFRSRAILCICLAVFIVWQGVAQSPNDIRPEPPVKTRQELAQGIRTVDRLFATEYKKEHSAGLTVGIVSGPQLVWTNNYGLADVENAKPATKETVYRIGSITKQFTVGDLARFVAFEMGYGPEIVLTRNARCKANRRCFGQIKTQRTVTVSVSCLFGKEALSALDMAA